MSVNILSRLNRRTTINRISWLEKISQNTCSCLCAFALVVLPQNKFLNNPFCQNSTGLNKCHFLQLDLMCGSISWPSPSPAWNLTLKQNDSVDELRVNVVFVETTIGGLCDQMEKISWNKTKVIKTMRETKKDMEDNVGQLKLGQSGTQGETAGGGAVIQW